MVRSLLGRGFACFFLIFAAGAAARAGTPAAPINLTGSIQFGTQIDLSWADHSSNETAFAVWRQVDGGTWSVLTRTAPNSVAASDHTVSVNHSYRYRVRAINNEGASAWSNQIALTVLPVYPPAPRGLITTANGGKIALDWIDTSAKETAFAIWRQLADGSWLRVGVVPANQTHFLDPTLGIPSTGVQRQTVPLAVERRAITLGSEVSLALSTAVKPFWRVRVPGAVTADYEWMVRDGVPNLISSGDRVDLGADTSVIAPQVQTAVAARLALAAADPVFSRQDLENHTGDNPRILQLPVLGAVTAASPSALPTSQATGLIAFWLTGASQSAVRGYFLSERELPGPNVRYRVRATNNYGASEWSNEAIWPGSVVSGTASLF
jgi:hypothetical protein